MCHAISKRTTTVKKPFIAFKVVRRTGATFHSEYAPTARGTPPPWATNQDDKGHDLCYTPGCVVEAPANSPGIFLYRREPKWRNHNKRVLVMQVPAGAKIRSGLKNDRNALTASKVIPLGLAPKQARTLCNYYQRMS